MGLSKTLKGIAMAGLPNSARAIRYARRRDALERQYAAPDAPGEFAPPGALVEADAGNNRFRFEQAELEVRFLAADMARLTWTPGTEPIPYALARTDWPDVWVARGQTEGGVTLAAAALSLALHPDGAITFRDGHGQALHTAEAPQRRENRWRQAARLRPEEALYGLGERAARLNLRGGRFQLWNQDAGGIYTTGQDPLYLSIPVYLALHAGGGYLVFHENTHAGLFDASHPERLTVEFEAGALRYYFIAGPPDRVLARYTELTGRPPLPPRWSLGYHHAMVAYRTEAEIEAVTAGFRERGLPMSVLHLDLDYMDGYRTFTIDARRFPNLKAIAADLLERGTRLAAIVDTAVKIDPAYSVYSSGLAAGAFCKLPDGTVLAAPVWPGDAAFPDFTGSDARAWWGTNYPALLEAGITGFWHDMNEPAAFTGWGDRTVPRPTRHALEGRGGDHAEAHNVYALQMNRAGREALSRLRPEQRPWLLTRAGFAGIQRYAWNWTGDIESSWQGLRQTVATVLGLGLSGQPFTGPDTGGFHGNPSPELYIRWFQCSAFLPFFRTMAAFTTPRREPWRFGPRAETIARKFLELRRRLMPFWYTLSWEASQTGWPLVRPLFWADPADPNLWAQDEAFVLGDTLLVAPALAEGARTLTVTLPPGQWHSFWDETAHTGPANATVAAPLEQIPLFVRAGKILPQEEGSRLALHLYVPPEGEFESVMYCDAGDGYGPALVNRFRVRRDGADLGIDWGREGEFPWPYAVVEMRLHGASAGRAWVDGVEVEAPADSVALAGPCRQVAFRLS